MRFAVVVAVLLASGGPAATQGSPDIRSSTWPGSSIRNLRDAAVMGRMVSLAHLCQLMTDQEVRRVSEAAMTAMHVRAGEVAGRYQLDAGFVRAVAIGMFIEASAAAYNEHARHEGRDCRLLATGEGAGMVANLRGLLATGNLPPID